MNDDAIELDDVVEVQQNKEEWCGWISSRGDLNIIIQKISATFGSSAPRIS